MSPTSAPASYEEEFLPLVRSLTIPHSLTGGDGQLYAPLIDIGRAALAPQNGPQSLEQDSSARVLFLSDALVTPTAA